MMKKFFAIPPRFLLPLMVLVALLTITVRAGDLWDMAWDKKTYTAVRHAQAEEKKPEAPPASTAPTETKPEEHKSDKIEAGKKEEIKPAVKETASPESDLYKQLAGRREQLDKRAQDLDTRESLIVVAEKRIDQKIKEMEDLRAQLQKLVGQASEAQAAQLENLVKVYEIMKPKEAAKIFESLEMPILLGVVQKMKPARTAAVLAEMNPEKAKEVTTALTQRDQLPEIK